MKTHEIIYKDAKILIAAKIAPIPVQADKTGDESLQDELKREFASGDKKAFMEAIHRIDRRASGAVVFARDKKTLVALNALIREGGIEKTYFAVTESVPEPAEGRLRHIVKHDHKRNVAKAIALRPQEEAAADAFEARAGGSEAGATAAAGISVATGASASAEPTLPKDYAALRYRIIGRSDRYALLEIRIETGRTHQIRAQLSAMGWPIRGDLKYGSRRSTGSGLIMLHARSVTFEHPSTHERVEAVAPFPEGEALWKAFGQDLPIGD